MLVPVLLFEPVVAVRPLFAQTVALFWRLDGVDWLQLEMLQALRQVQQLA